MLSHSKPSPKLKCYGAEAHGLIPVVTHMAHQYLDDNDVVELTVKQATLALKACYAGLSEGQDAATMASNCRNFCTLVVALEARRPGEFRVKPKLHQFQELCEMNLQSRPARSWTFRDEEFGGSIVQMGRRLGGANTPASVGTQTLLKFCGRHQVPDLR